MSTSTKGFQRGSFSNEPPTDFSLSRNREAMEVALKRVEAQLGREYPLLIGGKEIFTEDKLRSVNPSRPNQVVGVFQKGTFEIVEDAIEAARKAFQYWKRVPAGERVERLFRAGDILRQKKFELIAWISHEVGKTWSEADGEVAELIDFCEFYGREMLRLAEPQALTPVDGEKNHLLYIPLGVGVVIPPWNFPAALLGGMTLAAIVAGNTVIVKPSSDSPTVAAQFVSILTEAGVPSDVVCLFSGPGSTVGDALVAHPKTRFIAFTGSKEAGLHISEQAAKTQPGQIWVKRVVLEMGGKDAIIVDDEADIDAAVEGVAVSAFAYQGQKCSACSRAIVHQNVYDVFLNKLAERVKSMKIGPSDRPDVYIGPVINKNSKESILKYIEIGKKEGRLIVGGSAGDGNGFFLHPTIIADVDPKAQVAREEIFGPVLVVIRATDFEHALQIANDSEYGLTGSVYAKNRAKLQKASEEFHVGNLYFNRKCTGAQVGGHPFGGFNMSGTDSKVGGRDYLLLFLQAKVLSESL
jgi:1-pyrroline-5-carboxylate dehydrogenase